MGRNDTEQERLIHIDCLRILACFSVLMIHSAAQYWYDLPVTSKEWLIIDSYDAIVQFGVPVFVMVSGSLFLVPSRKLDLKKLYTHNILRMVVLYYVWSAVYGLFDCMSYGFSALSLKNILVEVFAGRYHLWYLPMTVGLYIILPILKSWLAHADKREVQYFLTAFLVFSIVRTTTMLLSSSEWLHFLWGAFEVGSLLEYPAYFVLGYYIVYYGIEKKWHKWIYLGGVSGACMSVVLANVMALRNGAPDGRVFDSFGIFTFLLVVSIFLFFQEHVRRWKVGTKAYAVIREISMATLGIYLMHLLCLESLQKYGIDSMLFSPVIGVPLCALICFVLCFFCAVLLRRIPVIGKYIC